MITRDYHGNKTAKIKQNQAQSRRGFVLAPPVTPDDIKHPNSKKIVKIKQSQAKSERGFDLSPRLTPDEINPDQATQ
jgi:hypothetical protein